ncbi:restriction endonuclease subunit S [Staphylococcus pseudoxylosus]|uniref:restriction endonuclease subunit S n=1 Tax=Staphylococcus pseudoxylosus TaxID=2282419 RepID=UPI00398B731D
MTNEARVKPQLRFEEFEGSWSKLNLNEVSERVKRKNGNLESLMPLTISGQYGLVDQITYFSKSVSAKNLKNYTLIKNGEFAYNKSYSNGYPLGAIKRLDKYEKGVLSTLYICFKVNGNNNSNFIKYFFETTKWHKEVGSIAVEGARNHGLLNISVNDFFNIMINLPSFEEQQKIGDFFSKLDRQIELEEQKLEKLEEQKKGYMQQIFSQKLRFKDEDGNAFEEWENTNFDYFMSEPDNLEKGIDLRKDQLLTVKLQGNGVSKANINRALKMGSTVYYKRFAGQFIYGKQNFFNGAFGIVPKSLNNFYSSGDVPALYIDYSKIDSEYFINYISREDYYKKKEAFSTGTGSKRIHEKTLLGFDIMLPSIDEQEKIGDFFNKLNNFIEKQSDKVELLKKRKQGFLQKMFV